MPLILVKAFVGPARRDDGRRAHGFTDNRPPLQHAFGNLRWGRRILSRDFVTRASSRLYHLNNIYYGYLWWSIDYPYKDRTVKAFAGGGNGGQGVMVIPELDLVVAVFGGNYNDGRATVYIQQELLPRFILPAVRELGDDKTAPVIEKDFKSPYGRSANTGRVSVPH